MRLKPNDLPQTEQGEIRNVTFKLGNAIGANAITEATISCPHLQFGTPLIDGGDIQVSVTFSKTGTHNILCTALLSSNETVKGFVRAHVVDSSCYNGVSNGYD